MPNETLQGKILYNKQMCEDWLLLLEDAPKFNRYDLKAISAILSAPCDLGTMVIRDEERSFIDIPTKKTLSLFYHTHRFFDYSLTKRCFSMIDGFSSYKVPFVNWHYALCPLEETQDCSWVNPLEIYDLQTIQGVCYAELINELVIEIPTQRRSFIGQAERAVYALGYLRREYGIIPEYNGIPLDYLTLPDTPFLKVLKERPLLHDWATDRGRFHHWYLRETVRTYRNRFK